MRDRHLKFHEERDNLPKPPAVVFAIDRHAGEKFGPDTLYSFSQVTLVRTVDDLESRGIKVYVVPIENDASQSGATAR